MNDTSRRRPPQWGQQKTWVPKEHLSYCTSRSGSDWKAVRQGLQKKPDAPIELYDLARDPGERTDVAAQNPDVVKRLGAVLKGQHAASEAFSFKALDAPAE